ncbi:unnamed protein product [Onchocerca flexuosa]|uniref:Uncharacterized protein n=1 Tax=Onchocerca flexuosa TaxID=387005 RepID=A0A3P7W8T1_9BILA|nr:unnamed protein product [Onchocerca flexuosa]
MQKLTISLPLNESNCETELVDSFGVCSPSPQKSLEIRKRSFVKTSEEMDEHFATSGMICNKNENKEDDKTEKTAFTKSGNLLDGVPLVAKSPPSDTEASLPVTGSTPDGSSKHDLSACTSSSLENENASKMESDKAHNCSENKRLNCIRSSRKKRVHKEFHKALLENENLKPELFPFLLIIYF